MTFKTTVTWEDWFMNASLFHAHRLSLSRTQGGILPQWWKDCSFLAMCILDEQCHLLRGSLTQQISSLAGKMLPWRYHNGINALLVSSDWIKAIPSIFSFRCNINGRTWKPKPTQKTFLSLNIRCQPQDDDNRNYFLFVIG